MNKKMSQQIDRIAELEKIKDFLNFDDIDKVNKSNLYFIDKENLLEIELVANLLKKVNVKSDSELGKEIINLMLFYRKSFSFLRLCSPVIAYGAADKDTKELLKEHYEHLAKSGLENMLKSYFSEQDYKKLIKVIKGAE